MAAKQSFTTVDSRVNPDELEQEVLTYWEKEQVFEQSLEQTKDCELFTFYDGPPYATGKPHYGHILQSSIKDTVLRYKTMRGYHVPRRVGWDTHGLPIEVIVEKKLGFKSKKDIEEYGIATFNQACKEAVTEFVGAFTDSLKRLGRWAEYDNAYYTLDRNYMETEWWIFKTLWDQQLVYKDFRSTPYCIRCETPLSNHEVSTGYKDREDQAVYVELPVKGKKNTSLLIWTTTPWTLPANVGVAYSEDVEYVKVAVHGKQYILAKNRVADVLGEKAAAVGPITHQELAQLTYEPPFPEMAEALGEEQPPFSLVPGGHVTDVDGTGLVHMAPAFGEEDALVGKEHGLPTLRTVRGDGTFEEALPLIGGKNIFEANAGIITELEQREVLIKQESYTHSYPHCWRCDEPLIYYALDTWFIRVSEFKDQLIKNNQAINWIPEHVKEGRFAKGLESAPDWAVSRNRYWSVPLPIWECDNCDERTCVGSVDELQQVSGASGDAVRDLHRPYVDDITWQCAACAGQMKRVEEVLDVWFDSGSMPYAQWHYPFENKELVERGFPADFIVEAIEMTRLWFYVLHVFAGALTNKGGDLGKHQPAFKNAIASGIIFAEDGQKLSKKLKNYEEPEPLYEKYGADTLRFYLLTSSSLGEPYRFSVKDMEQLHRNFYQRLWNVYSFFVQYANTAGWKSDETPSSSPLSGGEHNVLDEWILARTSQLENEVGAAADAYRIDQAARLFDPFVDDVSNWYVRRSRHRFQPARGSSRQQAVSSKENHDDTACFETLHEVLVRLCKVLAPFMPFVTENIYRNLAGDSSVHLQAFPDASQVSSQQQELLDAMARAREVVSEGLSLRASAGIKVRQPLAQLIIDKDADGFSDELLEIIKDEVNVKEVLVGELPEEKAAVSEDGVPVKVALSTELTPELKSEGLAREIVRHGQILRREAGYELNDRITLIAKTVDAELQHVLTDHKETIMAALQADELTDSGTADAEAEVTLNDHEISIGVARYDT